MLFIIDPNAPDRQKKGKENASSLRYSAPPEDELSFINKEINTDGKRIDTSAAAIPKSKLTATPKEVIRSTVYLSFSPQYRLAKTVIPLSIPVKSICKTVKTRVPIYASAVASFPILPIEMLFVKAMRKLTRYCNVMGSESFNSEL